MSQVSFNHPRMTLSMHVGHLIPPTHFGPRQTYRPTYIAQLNSFLCFFLLSSSISSANLSCVVATIFSSLAFLSTSVPMANLSFLLATTFSRYRDAVHRYRDVYLQLIFITSLQSFESGLALILIVFSY